MCDVADSMRFSEAKAELDVSEELLIAKKREDSKRDGEDVGVTLRNMKKGRKEENTKRTNSQPHIYWRRCLYIILENRQL